MDVSLSELRELVMDRGPGVLQFMGSQIVRHDWATDLIWSDATEIFEMDELRMGQYVGKLFHQEEKELSSCLDFDVSSSLPKSLCFFHERKEE